MRLEARSPSCFSNQFVLKLDGRAVGEFRGRWFSEGIDIRLTERLKLHFEKTSWLGSEFQLIDANTREVLASGRRVGFFKSRWELELGAGSAEMVRKSLFSFTHDITREGQRVASASRLGTCERGWGVEDDGTLDATDLVLVGLIYHTILQRQRNNNSG